MPNNHVLLERIELTQTTATVVLDNIPQSGYTDLKVVISGRTSRNNADPGSDVAIKFNNSSTGYYTRTLGGDGATAASGSTSNATAISAALVNSSFATANTHGLLELYISSYLTGSTKVVNVETITETNAATAFMRLIAASWDNASAITSISFTESNGFAFLAGSTFAIYGIAAVGATPLTAPKADGGNIIGTDGTYWYHAFLTNGTFKPQSNLSCDVLVVAGGGGGLRGGGGAGGVVYSPASSLATNASYPVVIGAGGIGGPTGGGNGSNSTLTGTGVSLTALGGAGGSGETEVGRSGGSGSGASAPGTNAGGSATQTSGSGFTGYGNPGGASSGSSYNGAGGGGAGSAGGATSGNNGGAGGAGLNTWSAWATATGTGVSGFYAGGGGGFGYQGTGGAAGSGGAVAGTSGSSTNNTTPATVNTGSGGGGGNSYTTGQMSSGGSGIVIVRYPVAS